MFWLKSHFSIPGVYKELCRETNISFWIKVYKGGYWISHVTREKQSSGENYWFSDQRSGTGFLSAFYLLHFLLQRSRQRARITEDYLLTVFTMKTSFLNQRYDGWNWMRLSLPSFIFFPVPWSWSRRKFRNRSNDWSAFILPGEWQEDFGRKHCR